MAKPAARSEGLTTRLLLGLVALIVAWFVIKALLGFLFSLIRVALFVALFAVIAWIVLVGPRESRD